MTQCYEGQKEGGEGKERSACVILQEVQAVTIYCSSSQQLCGWETLIILMHKFLFLHELKEEMSQLDSTSLRLKASGSSSVRKNVKGKMFSLKQPKTELRAAGTASDTKKEPQEDVQLFL